MAWAQPGCQHRCWNKLCTAIIPNPSAGSWCVKQMQALTYVEEHTVLAALSYRFMAGFVLLAAGQSAASRKAALAAASGALRACPKLLSTLSVTTSPACRTSSALKVFELPKKAAKGLDAAAGPLLMISKPLPRVLLVHTGGESLCTIVACLDSTTEWPVPG